MNYQFKAAKALYDQHIHPRVLVSQEDLSTLRKTTRSSLQGKLLQALRKKVAPLTERVLKADNLPQMLSEWNLQWTNPGTAIIFYLHDMALLAAIDGQGDTLEAVKRVILALPEADRLAPRSNKTYKDFRRGFTGELILGYDLLYHYLSKDERSTFTSWMLNSWIKNTLEELEPRYYQSPGANLTITLLLPTFMGLLAIEGDPGVPDLSDARRRMLTMFEATLYATIGPNGYPAEDIGYGTSMLGHHLASLVEALRRAGYYDVYTQCPRYAKFGRAMLHFVQPWGRNLSNTGDHGDDFGGRGLILSRLATEQNDPTLLWLLRTLSYNAHELPIGQDQQIPIDALMLLGWNDALKPKRPTNATVPTQYMDPSRGLVSFRSGWGDEDTLLIFDGSERPSASQGHEHTSSGHFSISAFGEYFAVDTGRYNAEQNCHNVVLVNGKSGRTLGGEWAAIYYHGNLTDYQPNPFCDTAEADSSHQHNCFWAKRHVGLVKGNGVPGYAWTVDDINHNNDWAEFWWQLHTSPENIITLRKNSATIQGCRQGNLMDVHLALPLPGSYSKDHTVIWEQDIAVPSSHKYIPDVTVYEKTFARPRDMVHHSMMRRPRLLAKVAGYNGRIMSVMLPRKKGEKAAKVEQIASTHSSLAMRITFEKVVDTLIYAYSHNLLEADGISERGQWCVVRRDRKTGRVMKKTVGQQKGG